jgi:hypothetical protein
MTLAPRYEAIDLRGHPQYRFTRVFAAEDGLPAERSLLSLLGNMLARHLRHAAGTAYDRLIKSLHAGRSLIYTEFRRYETSAWLPAALVLYAPTVHGSEGLRNLEELWRSQLLLDPPPIQVLQTAWKLAQDHLQLHGTAEQQHARRSSPLHVSRAYP